MVNPVVALLVLILYWRGGRTGRARTFLTAALLTVVFSITALFLTLGGTHGWWWLWSPVAALVLLLITARNPRVPRKVLACAAFLSIAWASLNLIILWVEDYKTADRRPPRLHRYAPRRPTYATSTTPVNSRSHSVGTRRPAAKCPLLHTTCTIAQKAVTTGPNI